ncbi:MAG: hypothetical protein QOI83_779, partial [Streptomycetaceae bacterium]|nr:hypothetical protein [Streptomycetaceae bacterium]
MHAQEQPKEAGAAVRPRQPAARPASGVNLPPTAGMTAAGIMSLQRSVGNAAVARMVEAERHEHGAGCGHEQAPAPVQRRSVAHEVLNSPGEDLDSATRTEMEGRYGRKLPPARVHRGPLAEQAAAELGAKAFTSQGHMVFGRGAWDKPTIAHEMRHLEHQEAGPVSGTDNGNGFSVSHKSDDFEKDAEASSVQAMRAPVSPDPVAPTEGETVGAARGGNVSPVQRMPTAADTARSKQAGVLAGEPVVQRAASTFNSEVPVQRMFNKLKGKVTGQAAQPAGPPQVQIDVAGQQIAMTWEGGFYRFTTPDGGTAFIHGLAVRNGVLGAGLAGMVMRYLNGGIVLYRGIPRWHSTWHEVTGRGVISPLGTGHFPSFDTRQTSFIPFAPTEIVARSAAVSTSGMGEADRAQFVNGYSRTQGNADVGLLAMTFAGPTQDVGFFNETEIQMRGPVHASHIERLAMDTNTMEALTGTAEGTDQLRSTRPATPSQAEKDDYTTTFG